MKKDQIRIIQARFFIGLASVFYFIYLVFYMKNPGVIGLVYIMAVGVFLILAQVTLKK